MHNEQKFEFYARFNVMLTKAFSAAFWVEIIVLAIGQMTLIQLIDALKYVITVPGAEMPSIMKIFSIIFVVSAFFIGLCIILSYHFAKKCKFFEKREIWRENLWNLMEIAITLFATLMAITIVLQRHLLELVFHFCWMMASLGIGFSIIKKQY